MCTTDFDPWTVYRSETRRARKQHACTECGRKIESGETYRYIVGMIDGDWSDYKQCEHCQAAATWLQVVCNGYLLDGILEELREHWGDGYRNRWLGRAIIGMRRRWRKRDGTLMPPPMRIESMDQAMAGMPEWISLHA